KQGNLLAGNYRLLAVKTGAIHHVLKRTCFLSLSHKKPKHILIVNKYVSDYNMAVETVSH
ncbi:hypothetical protein, partial [Lentilactobacillus hilgardii]|uniref:hypothetical protein n=1 Tax=Lentilactobacillus hilgardii TaxID=1588 RepID=UPI0021A2B7F3